MLFMDSLIIIINITQQKSHCIIPYAAQSKNLEYLFSAHTHTAQLTSQQPLRYVIFYVCAIVVLAYRFTHSQCVSTRKIESSLVFLVVSCGVFFSPKKQFTPGNTSVGIQLSLIQLHTAQELAATNPLRRYFGGIAVFLLCLSLVFVQTSVVKTSSHVFFY